MKSYKLIFIIIITFLIFISCEDRTDLTEPENIVNTGNADFAKFVSIGNSLTAGFQNGALYESSQTYSYGKLMADQVSAEYQQPLVSDPGLGGRMVVKSVDPFEIENQPSSGSPINFAYEGSYNNLAIPGIILADVLTTAASPSDYVGANPLIDLVLRGKGTVLEQTLSKQPTFMTVWIGNNDILGYATSGGLRPYTPIDGPVTFAGLYTQMLGAIAQAGIQNVVVANIPDVSSIPFFTTVGGQLLLQGITAIVGTKGDGSIAQLDLTKNLLTLQASEELAQGKGQSADNPLSNGVILDEDEIETAKTIIASYNASINAAANQFGYKVVDMHSFFNDIAQNGIVVDGIKLSAIYVQGGLFSLDGVHPTSQGYAVIANKFIQKINEEYSAQIPLINVSTIPASINLAKKVEYNKLGLPIFEKDTFDTIFY